MDGSMELFDQIGPKFDKIPVNQSLHCVFHLMNTGKTLSPTHNQPRRFSRVLALTILRLLNWKLDVTLPTAPKYVVIGAPHTSNWDLIYTLLMVYATGLHLHWLGKDTLFRGPFDKFFRWLGGIPVNRRERTNFVQQMVDHFDSYTELVLAVSPEGTRSIAKYWKTGFYHIARCANVPIAMGYIDYATRTVGIGPSFVPGGDIQADFELIKAFYRGKVGKNPHLQGGIELRPE